jgi:transposase
MSIDDKAIGHDGFTILSNNDTGKIAMMIESTRGEEVEQAMEKFGDKLQKIKHVSMDMSPTYAMVFNDLVPNATQVIDKFHVMKYVYEAVGEVRNRIKKELSSQLTKGRKRTEEDKKILKEVEFLRRVQHAVTQSPDKWNTQMKETINEVFTQHEDLKTAYEISQNFKQWYTYKNTPVSYRKIKDCLDIWYIQTQKISEFDSVRKMIRKHETEILNFFKHGLTNAKAENINGKIQRFVSSNFGVKDNDFLLYRIAGYFS